MDDLVCEVNNMNRKFELNIVPTFKLLKLPSNYIVFIERMNIIYIYWKFMYTIRVRNIKENYLICDRHERSRSVLATICDETCLIYKNSLQRAAPPRSLPVWLTDDYRQPHNLSSSSSIPPYTWITAAAGNKNWENYFSELRLKTSLISYSVTKISSYAVSKTQ